MWVTETGVVRPGATKQVRKLLIRGAGGYAQADIDAWFAHALVTHCGHYADPAVRQPAAADLLPHPTPTHAGLLAALTTVLRNRGGRGVHRGVVGRLGLTPTACHRLDMTGTDDTPLRCSYCNDEAIESLPQPRPTAQHPDPDSLPVCVSHRQLVVSGISPGPRLR